MNNNKNNKEFFAGSLQIIDNYKAYIPNKINRNFKLNDNRTLKLLEESSVCLGRLNQLCHCISFINAFTNIHVNLEALGSSEIEGTKADIKDLIDFASKEYNINDEKQRNSKKVINLYKITHGLITDKLKLNKKYSIETFEMINKELFNDINPESKYAGKIRQFQNYIGGNSIMDAMFVPPPPKVIKELINDLNDFWYDESFYIPVLIKIAIYHFQYETIHPFVDGNGRMGRLLINLQLKDSNLLDLPILCLSNYWKRNKGLYYEALTTTRFSQDFEHWIRFFLMSIKEACIERIQTIQEIDKLADGYINKINKEFKNTNNYNKLLRYLLEICPIITVKEIQDEFGLSYQGTNKIIDNFVKLGILKETSSNKRNRRFIFQEYHDLVFNLIDKS